MVAYAAMCSVPLRHNRHIYPLSYEDLLLHQLNQIPIRFAHESDPKFMVRHFRGQLRRALFLAPRATIVECVAAISLSLK